MRCGPRQFRSPACLAIGLACACPATVALAENASPLPEWVYSTGIAHEAYLLPAPERWEVSLGLSVDQQPRYDGASAGRFFTLPLLDVRYDGWAFLSTSEGLGVNLLRGKTYRGGLALTYDEGRRHGARADTNRLDDVSATAEAKLFFEAVVFPFALRVDARRGLGARGGWIGDVGAYLPVTSSDRFTLFAGASVTVADREYEQAYFGITPAESARSGLPGFQAAGGIKSASLGINAVWSISSHWFLDGVAAVDKLLGDAEDSPLARQKTQAALGVTLGYGF